MEKLRNFLKRKDIVFSAKRYFIDAMGAMAQGLFCTLLVGTILDTIGNCLSEQEKNELLDRKKEFAKAAEIELNITE